MIIEPIGCSGAGKTTLSQQLRSDRIEDNNVVAMSDLVRNKVGLRYIKHPTAVNVIQDLAGLPFFTQSWNQWRYFVHFSRGILTSHSPSTIYELNSIRGIIRRTGMYELARRRAENKLVIFDEGTLSIVYRIFIYTDFEFETRHLETFARLVPLPDKVIYVRAPISSLIQRSKTRPDRRHQLSGKNARYVADRIQRAVDVFDMLVTTSPLRDKVVIVDNGDGAVDDSRQLESLRLLLKEWSSSPPGANKPAGSAIWR